jgi:hypothetical protein
MKRLTSLLALSFISIAALAQSQIIMQPQMMVIINPGAAGNGPTVNTNPNLSYQMLGNEAPVNSELTLLKAKEAEELGSPVTVGGLFQTGVSSSSTSSP